MRTRWGAAFGLMLLFPSARTALGDDPRVAAQVAFDEGRRLEDAGDFVAAAARFQESERLDPALGTLLNLANCYERAGKLASAWRTFVRGAEEAAALGEDKRAQRATERAEALRPRLSTIVVRLESEAAPGEEVRLDGALMDQSLLRVPQPIDGAVHEVKAEAPGRVPWRAQLAVANESQTLSVAVPDLALVAELPPAVPKEERGAGTDTRPDGGSVPVGPALHAQHGWWTPFRVGSLAIAGAGVGLLGLGVAYGIEARDRWSARQSNCAYNVCNDTGYALTSQARDAANVATWAFILGGTAIASGVTMFILAPHSTTGPAVAAEVSPAGGSLRLQGGF